MDKKINKLLESDKRTHSIAFPLPKIPAPFIELLPITSINSLEAVEQLLSVDCDNFNRNVEELVSLIILILIFHYFLYLKTKKISNSIPS